MNVRYSKEVEEDGGERVERLAGMIESADTSTDHRVECSTQNGGTHAQKHHPAVHRNTYIAAALILCLLIVVGVTVKSRLFNLEIYQISEDYKQLQTSYEELRNGNCQLRVKKKQTEGKITGWRRFQCTCYYKSTEMKSWTDSRKDCQSRGADLVIVNSKEEQDFLGELNKPGVSWIGLHAVEKHNWKEESEWKWVDGSIPTYLGWQLGVNVKPVDGSRGYIDLEGKLKYANNGSKQWICEKPMY